MSLTFCSSEDDAEEQEQMTNEQETTVLDENTIVNGLIISGANKITGNAPQPTGNLSFTLDGKTSALLNEGFDINFSSNENIAGAYLVIADSDGNVASDYFDIPESAFEFAPSIETNRFGSKQKGNREISSRQNGNGELGINIGFNNSLPVGIFCYTLCVYDNNGNISAPQTVCITIQNWGGNNDLVANWSLSRYQENYQGMTIDVGLNEEYCTPDTIFCNNGNTLNFEYCSSWQEFTMQLNSDGTYTIFLNENDSDIDYDASINTCSIVNLPNTNYQYTSQGNWAFNDTDQKLVLAEYSWSYIDGSETDSGTYPAGNAEIVFDDSISISGNTFRMTFNDGVDEEIIYTFSK